LFQEVFEDRIRTSEAADRGHMGDTRALQSSAGGVGVTAGQRGRCTVRAQRDGKGAEDSLKFTFERDKCGFMVAHIAQPLRQTMGGVPFLRRLV
jgi:hypothetical protein